MTLVRTMMTVLNNGDDNWCCQDVDAVGKTVDSDVMIYYSLDVCT